VKHVETRIQSRQIHLSISGHWKLKHKIKRTSRNWRGPIAYHTVVQQCAVMFGGIAHMMTSKKLQEVSPFREVPTLTSSLLSLQFPNIVLS
jgi:hypothetical protein